MRFARVLVKHGAQVLQDAAELFGDTSFEKAIHEIPGQRLSLVYFFMLTRVSGPP